jgi:methylmalonyl-CoA mutase
MADDAPLSLVADFPPAQRADWLALVEKTLGGADFDAALTSRTADGLIIQPLYTADDASPSPTLRRASVTDPARPWDLRTLIDHPDPARANADALADLTGGAASVRVQLDPSGVEGVAVASEGDLARVLDGVLLDLAPVALDAGLMGARAAAWLGALAKGAPAAPLAFNLDPISAFAARGAAPTEPAESADQMAALAQTYPKATLYLASGLVVHEAGGTEAQEVGFALAAALAYAKALHAAGLSLPSAFQGVALSLAADADSFVTLAKFRAARQLMTRLAQACDVALTPRIEARSSRRMLAKLDPWVNLLRLASAGFGAALGGADVIQLDPFTQPLGHPSPLARRQARNIQLVLMEESELGRVADPAAGSWFLDRLTDQIARAAWTQFQTLEGEGGALAALQSGRLAAEVADARARLVADIAAGKPPLIGVTKYLNAEASVVEVEAVDAAAFAKPYPQGSAPPLAEAFTPFRPWRAAEPFEV